MRSLLTIAFIVATSTAVNAVKLQAMFDYCRFYSPDYGNYLETYLSVNGNSIQYQSKGAKTFQGKIEMELIFTKNGTVAKSQKYIIESPVVYDTTAVKPNFITQERILLDTGNYQLEIKITDLYRPEEQFSAKQKLEIEDLDNQISISDIQQFDSLIASTAENKLAKSGYEFIPYSSEFYPKEVNELGFYFEIYNVDKVLTSNEAYLVTYFIEGFESGSIAGSYKGFKKKNASEVSAIASKFNIDELPSGNYNLVVEVRNRENELLSDRKLFFMRSNPGLAAFLPEETAGTFVDKIENPDTLAEYINMLEPISGQLDIEFAQNQLDVGDIDLMRQYFLNFWLKKNPENPEKAWHKYHEQVKRVNINYGTRSTKGYLSDRGFRYLKYGPPNNIDKRYFEPSTYPYEVWQYYQINGQANRRIIFWSPSSVSDDFDILHSDIRGEVQNPQWRYKLTIGNSATPTNREIDRPRSNQFGSSPILDDWRDR